MHKPIRSVIVDDEPGNIITLTELLKEYCPDVIILGTAPNPIKAIDVIEQAQPNLVFLDIEMPYGNAFDLLDRIKPRHFEVIFITAFNNYAVKAFKYAAVDYILKPINILELKEAVSKASERIDRSGPGHQVDVLLNNLKPENANAQKIGLPNAHGISFEVASNIMFLKAEGNYTRVFIKDRHIELITKPLKHFEDILSGMDFCRIHNSYIVNINYVKKYVRGRGGFVEMEDGTEIEVAVRRKDEFLGKYKR